MAQTTLTLAELFQIFLTNFENELSQTSPLADKAFLRVDSAGEAALAKLLFKFAEQESKENLATTASESALEAIGSEYGVDRRQGTAAILQADLPANNGTNVPGTSTYTGDSNAVRYNQGASVIAALGVAAIETTASDIGVAGNLVAGQDTMTIGTLVAGASTVATVTATTQLGTEIEDLESYRDRVLAEIRSQGGGGNASDYKDWTERTDGVEEGYVYAGTPTDQKNITDTTTTATVGTVLPAGSEYLGDTNAETYYTVDEVTFDVSPKAVRIQADAVGIDHNMPDADTLTLQSVVSGMGTTATVTGTALFGASFATALPGDRTAFVEAETSLDPDGYASEALLDAARDNINADEDTGEMNPPLGETNETLWVNSIFRTSIYVEITGLNVPSGQIGNAKADIDTSLTNYFASVKPFITGLTPEADRNDLITRLTVSTFVQDALSTYGGSATDVEIRLLPTGVAIPEYRLNPGEKAKYGGATYV